MIVWVCVPIVGLVVSGVVGALTFGRELLFGGQSPPASGGRRGRGGPPRDPAPLMPVTPQVGRMPEAPDRQPVLTG